MTGVLYWRVKVDNAINLFSATGSKLLAKGLPFEQLHSVQWQPHPVGAFKKPSLANMSSKAAEEEKAKQPKRLFSFGG